MIQFLIITISWLAVELQIMYDAILNLYQVWIIFQFK